MNVMSLVERIVDGQLNVMSLVERIVNRLKFRRIDVRSYLGATE